MSITAKVDHDQSSAVEVLRPKVGDQPPAGTLAGFVPMTWSGAGPIISWPELVSVFWGDFTPGQVSSMTTFLAAYADYLSNGGAPGGQQCVVSQYGVRGASVGASHTVSVQPQSATENDVHNLVNSLQQQGSLPAYSPNRLFIVFTHGITFTGYGTQWCAYHGSWGDGQYFAIVPFPVVGGCGSNTPDASWQSTTSHEINEAATDPGVGTGWVSGSEEGGDTCAWQEQSMPFGTIQLFEDNAQSSCSTWTPHRGNEWHTIRNADGTWQPNYGLIEGQEHNNPGPFMYVACAGVGNTTMHVVSLSEDGRQWHTIRNADGTWQPDYGLIEGQEQNDPGPFIDVACGGVGDALHVVGLSRSGQMWHTIRNADGTWQPTYGLIESQSGNDPGPFIDVACAGVGDTLQVVGLARDGRQWHTIRYPGGNWQPNFGLIEGQESNDPGPFIDVACAGVGDTLHVVSLSLLGKQWHTIRDANGGWQPSYGLIEDQEHNDPGPFLDVSCAGVGDTLQVVGLSLKGQQWHTIRYSDGTWQPNYGLVESQSGNDPGPFIDVGCAGVGYDLQLVGIA